MSLGKQSKDIGFSQIVRLFSEASNRKSLNPTGNNISRDSSKTSAKIRRDEKHLCPYW